MKKRRGEVVGKKEKKTHREPSFRRFVGGGERRGGLYTQCDIEASTASLSYSVIGRVEEAKVGRRWNWRREWKTEEGEGGSRRG